MDKTKALQILSFLHNKLLHTNFYPEEFAQADAALKLIHSMASDLDKQLQEEASLNTPVSAPAASSEAQS